MSRIRTYPAPSTSLVEAARSEMSKRRSGRPMSAAFKYAREAAVEIEGLQVRMSVKAASDILKFVVEAGTYLPVAVDHDDYLTAQRNAEKARVFKAHCDRLGLVDGQEDATGHCDSCGASTKGKMQFAPDATGYPTPVLFTCGSCGCTC